MDSISHWFPSLNHVALVHSYLGERVRIHPPAQSEVSIRNSLRFFRSPVPNSERNTKFSLTGPSHVGEKKVNFGLRILFNNVRVYAACFHAQRCMRFTPKFVCGCRLSAVPLGCRGNTRWTRSIIGTARGSSLSIPPTLSSDIHDREMDSEWALKPLKKIKSNKSKIRNKGKFELWIYWHVRSLWIESNTSPYIGRRTRCLGARYKEG